jgi:hypothetical protein
MNFSTSQTFTTVQEIGNYWYFDRLGISLDNANATVLSWLTNNQVVLNLTSILGTATVLMDLSVLQTSPVVSGASAYTFNVTSGILNVTKSSFTVQVITISLSPIYITGLTVNSYDLAQNVPFYLNATVYDEWGSVSLTSFTLEFSHVYQVQVSWSLGAWTIPYGSVNCMLITAGCSVTQNDTYSEVFTFELKLSGSTPEQSVDVLSAGTLASDAYGNTATTSLTNLATYPGTPIGPGPGPNPSPSPSPLPTPNPSPSPSPTSTPNGNGNNSDVFQLPGLPDIPPIIAQIPFSPVYLLFGIIVIFAVVGITGFYAGTRKNPLKDAQKEWENQMHTKDTKWNKD